MDKRMAILDLDMTLLDGNGSLPPSTRETLDRMIERDIKVVIASGRRWSKLKPCLGGWMPNAPVISSNGSVIIDPHTEEPISVETVSMDTAAEVYFLRPSERHVSAVSVGSHFRRQDIQRYGSHRPRRTTD